MLHLALAEAGIDAHQFDIGIDHNLGVSRVNSVLIPVVYPRAWALRAQQLHNSPKLNRFWFKGFPGKDNSRLELLAPFESRSDSAVMYSNRGRQVDNKRQYDKEYYSELAQSEYGLCPHQLDWPGDRNQLWTYRYIECLFTGVIPVNFRRTALGTEFVGTTYFEWDDEILEKENTHPSVEAIQHNLEQAQKRFLLTEEQVKRILDSK